MILYIAVTVITVLAACFVRGQRERASAGGGSTLALGKVSCGSAVTSEKVSCGSAVTTKRDMTDRAGLTFIFLVLFILSAIRFNMGDYWKYVEFMHLIRCDSYVPTEWGFNLLVKIIYGLSGFENYKLVFAIYSFLTVLFFMMAIYEQSIDFKFSFFMFMTLGLYFQSFCTMRYYLALAIALWSIKFLKRRQYVIFVIVILLASGFHKSVFAVIPLYILAMIPWKRFLRILFAGAALSLVIFRNFWMHVATILYPTYKETSYVSEGGSISYANIARCVAVLLFTLYVAKHTGDKKLLGSFMSKLNIMALVMYVCCWYIPFVSRIGYYMTVTQIIFVPELIMLLAQGRWKEEAAGHTDVTNAMGQVETMPKTGSDGVRVRRRAVVIIGLACMMYFAVYLKRAYSSSVNVLPYKSYLFEDSTTIVQDVS